MKWAVGAITAPRPKPTLRRSLASLRRAGWSDVLIAEDTHGVGQLRNWRNALTSLVERERDADAYLLVEDDVVFCRDLRGYLERVLWPASRHTVALCSVYTPTVYMLPHVSGRIRHWGFNEQRRGFHLVGALAWILPPESAYTAALDLDRYGGRPAADYQIGKWAEDTRRSVWYHNPSLAQHIGLGNSALGDTQDGPLRRAGDFIGEDASPEALMESRL